MSISYTLSDIAADFGSGAKHVANSASPFLGASCVSGIQ